MIRPDSRIRATWDWLVIATAVGAALGMPLGVVFGGTANTWFLVGSFLVSLVFASDLYLTFRTSYIEGGKLVADRALVARRYLSGWFAIDVAALLPTGLIISLAVRDPAVAISAISLTPLIKLVGIGRFIERITSPRINPALLRLGLLLSWIFLAAHLIASGWMLILGDAGSLPPLDRYVSAFYWTITTITTIGYGDITPSGTGQTLFVIFIEILGAGLYGLLIGNIANLIANIDVAKAQYREKLDRVNAFLKYRDIPAELQRKINAFFEYMWDSRRGYDESEVLAELPDPLKVSVSLYLNRQIIAQVPFFEDASDELIRDIIMNLTPVVFTPDDHIIRAGEVGYDMFFISKGSVDVVSPDERVTYVTLGQGQFFGEIALLLSAPRNATIKAKEYCDLYRLDKETFDRILSHYPEFAATIHQMAKERREGLEIQASAAKTDETPTEQAGGMRAPRDISVELSEDGIVLTWAAVADATTYDVVRDLDDSGQWQFLAQSSKETSVVDTDSQTSGSRRYRIRGHGKRPGPWSAMTAPVVIARNRAT